MKYDVALSFAGENRNLARDLADYLKGDGYKVFFDEYERSSLWGKNLYEHLSTIYSEEAHFCVIFISTYYAKKLWTTHERRAAQERALHENREYILPIRLDDTPIEGISKTIGYLDLRKLSIEDIYKCLVEKIGPPHFIQKKVGNWKIEESKKDNKKWVINPNIFAALGLSTYLIFGEIRDYHHHINEIKKSSTKSYGVMGTNDFASMCLAEEASDAFMFFNSGGSDLESSIDRRDWVRVNKYYKYHGYFHRSQDISFGEIEEYKEYLYQLGNGINAEKIDEHILKELIEKNLILGEDYRKSPNEGEFLIRVYFSTKNFLDYT